jgi:hypothetical protein
MRPSTEQNALPTQIMTVGGMLIGFATACFLTRDGRELSPLKLLLIGLSSIIGGGVGAASATFFSNNQRQRELDISAQPVLPLRQN